MLVQQIEGYTIIKQLGQGGFGKTFLVEDTSQHRYVAKQLYYEGKYNQKIHTLFFEEAKRLETVGSYSRIPSFIEYFEIDNSQWIIQEYITGQTLADLIKEKTYKESEVIELLQEILPILRYLHRNKVIHRDIKPENIIYNPEKGYCLVDFGAAKIASKTQLAHTATIIGSAGYTSPEQSRGKPTYASDIYSLGMTAIVALTNEHPFELIDNQDNQLNWQLYCPAINNNFAVILNRMLSDSLRNRYKSASETLINLASLDQPACIVNSDSNSKSNQVLSVIDKLGKLVKSRTVVYSAIGVIAIGGVVAIGWKPVNNLFESMLEVPKEITDPEISSEDLFSLEEGQKEVINFIFSIGILFSIIFAMFKSVVDGELSTSFIPVVLLVLAKIMTMILL